MAGNIPVQSTWAVVLESIHTGESGKDKRSANCSWSGLKGLCLAKAAPAPNFQKTLPCCWPLPDIPAILLRAMSERCSFCSKRSRAFTHILQKTKQHKIFNEAHPTISQTCFLMTNRITYFSIYYTVYSVRYIFYITYYAFLHCTFWQYTQYKYKKIWNKLLLLYFIIHFIITFYYIFYYTFIIIFYYTFIIIFYYYIIFFNFII